MNLNDLKLCIIGLGYVGLPIAVEFGKKRKTLGFDINKKRIYELINNFDSTLENSKEELISAKKLIFSSESSDLEKYNCYIVSVPTPIDEFNKPDLNPLKTACRFIGKYLRKGDLVIFESTVYPGCTEEVCVPILEEISNLKFNLDFYCGYSPERINPGDKNHKLKDIKKVTSGSNEIIAELVDKLYNQIIPAGTYKAKSIKVAEAAKVIENTQRDINIALINELAMLFNKIGIDTESVLKAAETKWNFNSYKPGLVGGHCISVDPYYLTYKAEQIGFKTEIISAGRKINDYLPKYITLQLFEKIKEKKISLKSTILIMGVTFKENCPDVRNSKVKNLIDCITSIDGSDFKIELYDPWLSKSDFIHFSDHKIISKPKNNSYEILIIAVRHEEFKKMGSEKIQELVTRNSIIYDLKYVLEEGQSDIRL